MTAITLLLVGTGWSLASLPVAGFFCCVLRGGHHR